MDARPSVVVSGPPGCGKTTLKYQIRNHFGMSQVIDWVGARPVRIPDHGAVVLCVSTAELSSNAQRLQEFDFYEVQAAMVENRPARPKYDPQRSGRGMTASVEPPDMVDVHLVVREVTRYERTLRMPRALYEFNREQLRVSAPCAVEDVAFLVVECFTGHTEGDSVRELTEIEAFELVDRSGAPPDVLVDPGGSAVPTHPLPQGEPS